MSHVYSSPSLTDPVCSQPRCRFWRSEGGLSKTNVTWLASFKLEKKSQQQPTQGSSFCDTSDTYNGSQEKEVILSHYFIFGSTKSIWPVAITNSSEQRDIWFTNMTDIDPQGQEMRQYGPVWCNTIFYACYSASIASSSCYFLSVIFLLYSSYLLQKTLALLCLFTSAS